MKSRIPLVRPPDVCFTVTSEPGITVTVLPFRNVISATPPAPVLIRSPSTRFIPLTPGSATLAPAGIRSTGAASTLSVAATSVWALTTDGRPRAAATTATAHHVLHVMIRLHFVVVRRPPRCVPAPPAGPIGRRL